MFVYSQSNPEQQKRKIERFNSAQKRRRINNESTDANREPNLPTETIAEDLQAEKLREEDLYGNVTPNSSQKAEKSELMFEINNLREERDKALAMVEDAKKRFLSYENLKSRSEDKFKCFS